MRKLIVLILPVFFCICTECRGKDTSIPEVSPPIWGENSLGLRIAIEIREPRFKFGGPAFVFVTIENVTNKKINYSSIPSFTFNDRQYWCPVDLVKGASSLPANARVNLSMDGNAVLETRLDLSQLNCGQGYSSIWPQDAMYSIVPVGEYAVRLDIEVIDRSENNWIYSNEVNVEIAN
jgi:hypothetical protein